MPRVSDRLHREVKQLLPADGDAPSDRNPRVVAMSAGVVKWSKTASRRLRRASTVSSYRAHSHRLAAP